MKILLDTNAYSAMRRGETWAASKVQGAKIVVMSVVVVGELLTADRFGLIAMTLRRKGRPIPTNDIWIAAHAMEAGADLISADRHFGEVDGLAWTMP